MFLEVLLPNPFSSSKKKSVSDLDSPFSVNSEETEHMPKSAEKDD